MGHSEAERRGDAPNAAAHRSATNLQKQLFVRVWWPESGFDERGLHAGVEPSFNVRPERDSQFGARMLVFASGAKGCW